MDYIIKKLSSSDSFLARQLITLFGVEFEDVKPSIPGDKHLQDLLSNDTFHAFVAVENDRVVGGVTAYELPMFGEEVKEMFLYDIAVDKSHWNKGIAGELISALKKTCSEKGIKIMFVGTDIDHEAAIQLYKKTGATMEEIAWFTYEMGI